MRHLSSIFCCLLLVAAATADEPRAALDQIFRVELQKLEVEASRAEWSDEAQLAESWQIERDPRRIYLFLPQALDSDSGEAQPPGARRQWHERFRQLRRQYGQKLFELSQQIAVDEPARAFRMLHEVLREDPDHAAARRIVGAAQQTLRDPRVSVVSRANRSFGFAAREHWRLLTPHFEIVTNTLDAGRQLASELEQLHAAWQQVFFTFWSSGERLNNAFARGALTPSHSRRHLVVLFGNRQQYIESLRSDQPQIEVTVGIYLDTKQTSYFYVDPENLAATRATWRHEATHQLFSETVRPTPGVGSGHSFWILEGVAMFMESLAPAAEPFHCWTVGGIEAERLQVARYRALCDQFHLPLAELTALGRDQLYHHPDLRKLYSESAGLATFLMTRDERSREAVVAWLKSLYDGTAEPAEFSQLLQASGGELDRQYLQWHQDINDGDLRFVRAPHSLCLARTQVSDKGLLQLSDLGELQWLDVAYTRTGDAGAEKVLRQAPQLRRLRLEGTAVTDAAVAAAAACLQLQELDLTKTRITSDGLGSLAPLQQLEILWLSENPQIDDQAVPHLRQLRRLRSLKTQGARFSTEGLRQLQAALPNWKP